MSARAMWSVPSTSRTCSTGAPTSKVEHVTVWLLSTDNLRRPADELEPLLRIIAGVAEELSAPGKPWRVRAVGALDLLPGADRSGAQVGRGTHR